MSDVFIDSNIILYFLDTKDTQNQLVALQLLKNKPKICSQVLVEVANVCKRKFGYNKNQLLSLWQDLLTDCEMIATTQETTEKAIALTYKYDFQLFDALIISSALENNCNKLYSEDMQHGMIVENVLTIFNPFLPSHPYDPLTI